MDFEALEDSLSGMLDDSSEESKAFREDLRHTIDPNPDIRFNLDQLETVIKRLGIKEIEDTKELKKIMGSLKMCKTDRDRGHLVAQSLGSESLTNA